MNPIKYRLQSIAAGGACQAIFDIFSVFDQFNWLRSKTDIAVCYGVRHRLSRRFKTSEGAAEIQVRTDYHAACFCGVQRRSQHVLQFCIEGRDDAAEMEPVVAFECSIEIIVRHL